MSSQSELRVGSESGHDGEPLKTAGERQDYAVRKRALRKRRRHGPVEDFGGRKLPLPSAAWRKREGVIVEEFVQIKRRRIAS